MNGLSLKRFDWTMFGTILMLVALSVAFVYSAQFKSDLEVGSKWWKQLLFAGMGLCAYGVVVWYDYQQFARLSWWIYGGALVLLLMVFLFPKVNGAHRWIPLPGFTLQPSELGKIAVVVALAAFLAAPDRDMDEWRTFWGCVAIAGLPFLLIAAEPDLSTSLTFAPITLAMLLYKGVQRKLLLIGVAVVLVVATAACFWIKFETSPQIEAMAEAERPAVVLPRMPFLEDYQKGRIKVFLTKDYDKGDAGWNKLQSQIAVGSGGLHGKGYLKGTQNILGFLPRTVAPTDFIFCVIAEETGFMGGAFFILLYTVLLGRCMRVSFRSRDEFGRLMALGIGVMVFCHVFVNIAMTIGILPITGLPLPLLSYGGSFMVSTMIALGLVQSVYQRRRIR
ncbi:rod shape-determining protein RodA [Pontiella sulfatireligans]|uniref:Peptidoglycan glycosyltransferase MrdB n=1 Tax=Pontiella sulfatireligans TaxID=2750658 RepID=A0A6C2UPE1_9BACT|nr:rod shape-determining protein RodA [Pontiella sulfatireligans]VGO22068.1 Peptidoglycan glycosyltransferase MrdB [Pontiella sulfatireligans]